MKCVYCNQEHPDNYEYYPITGATIHQKNESCGNHRK